MRACRSLTGLAVLGTLVACGGGSGSSSTGAQPAATTPTTSATPTPTASAQATLPGGSLNVRVGLHQLAQFPTLSWIYRPDVAGDANGTDLVQFGWDALQKLSIATVPGFPTGGLIELATETSADLSFSHVDPNFGSPSFFDRGVAMMLLVPGTQNKIFPLEYTSAGWIGWQGINTPPESRIAGSVVYGVPTAQSDMPLSGTARFAVFGYSVQRARNQVGQANIGGPFGGNIEADFAGRKLSGDFGLTIGPRVVISTSSIAIDGTFSGTVTFEGDPGPATFEGRFTGPQAREFMLRWRTSDQFGTLAGRRV